MDRFIDKYCRDETGKYFFSEASKVTHQEAAFQRNYTKQDNHDPETNPTAPWQELQVIDATKLERNQTTNMVFYQARFLEEQDDVVVRLLASIPTMWVEFQ